MKRSPAASRRSPIAAWAVGCSLLALAMMAAAGCGGGSKAKLIVYEAKSSGGTTNVWTVDPGNGESVQLTSGEGFDGNPGWSPDRKRIIFTSDRDSKRGTGDIYVMDSDGENVKRLTNTPDEADWSPKFSPDGDSISFVAGAGSDFYLVVMDADGSDPERVAGSYSYAEFPSWRRDGAEVYFSAIEPGRNNADIYSYDVETREVKTRISTPFADVCPHFTYDGKTMTYASASEDEPGNVDLFAHDLTSDDTTGASDARLTDDPALDDYGNPSPDNKSMVFLSNRESPGATYTAGDGDTITGNTELYLMDRDGKNQRQLTDTPGHRENVPDW